MDYTTSILSNPPADIDAPIFVDADHPEYQISWQQYSVGVRRVAVGLQANTVLEQECIGLLSPNDIYCSILADGIVAAGAIYIPFPAAGTETELINDCKTSQVRWLFAAPELLARAKSVADAAGLGAERVLLFDSPSALARDNGQDAKSTETRHTGLKFSSILTNYSEEEYENPNVGKDPKTLIANRVFTSGTTGSSKAANLSHTATIARYTDPNMFQTIGPVRMLHFIAMHHVSALWYRLRAAAGHQCMYITNVQEPEGIIDLIRQYEITNVLLPPRSLIAVTRSIESGARDKKDVRSLRLVVEGGNTIENSSLDACKALLPTEAQLLVSYGLTETGTLSTADWTPGQTPGRSGFSGVVNERTEVKIVDPETHCEVDTEVDGEIWGRGTQLFNGYCNNEEATRESLIKDDQGHVWFRTGDKGRMTAKREVLITGRYKEVFRVGTEDVVPTEVETLLMKHPGIQDAAVVGTTDRNDSHYSEVKAYVVAEEQSKVSAQSLVDFVAAHLSHHKAPTGGVSFIAEIPRNAMKKVVKRELCGVKELPGSVGYMDIST